MTETLLSLTDLQAALEEHYRDDVLQYPDAFASSVPRPSNKRAAIETALAVKNAIGAELPASFIEGLSIWDLGQLRIGNTVFCLNGEYGSCLIKYNSERPRPPWWDDTEDECRPSNRLMISTGDPHIALLDLENGAIEAYVVDEGSLTSKLVAHNLVDFLRGLGTIQVRAGQAIDSELFALSLARDLQADVGLAYWKELVIAKVRK